MNTEETYNRWIASKQREGPGPGFTRAVMERIDPAPAERGRAARWLGIAAIWTLATAAGVWRATLMLGPLLGE